MYEFKAEGMSCGSCVAAVTRGIKGLDPEAKVSVDLREGRIKVESAEAQARIAALIEETGYKVTESRISGEPA